MTTRTVILCGRSRQSRRLATRTIEDIDRFQRPRFLYITGGQRKAELIRESFWRAEDKAPTFLPEVQTWGHYRQQLCERFGGPRAELAALPRDMLIGKLWLRIRNQTRRWAGLPDSPSTRRGLAELLDDWQQSFSDVTRPEPGPSPDDFPFISNGVDPSHAPDPDLRHDLWLLAQAWTEQLDASNSHTDRAGATRQLLAALQRRPLAPSIQLHLGNFTSLVVDDLLWLSPLDRALLDALIDAFLEASPQGQVRLCLETNHHDEQDLSSFASGRGLFDRADSRASQALRRNWHRRIEDGSASIVSAHSAPLAPDLSDLLATDGFVDLERGTGAIRLRSYGSELAEVRAIARSIKARLRSGARARDCAVAFPALDRYLPLVRDSFAAYGIPFVIEKGAALAVSPPISAARQLLRLVARSGGRDELRALFAADWLHYFVKIADADIDDIVNEAIPGVDISDQRARDELRRALSTSTRDQPVQVAGMNRVYRSLLEAGCIQGPPRRWMQPVVGLRRSRLRSELQRIPLSGQVVHSRQRWDGIARAVRELHALDHLYKRVERLKRCPDISTAAVAFKALLVECGLVATKTNSTEGADPLLDAAHAENTRALDRFDELLDEISTADRICAQVSPPTQASRAAIIDLHDILEQVISDTYYRSGPSVDGVSITGLRDLRGVDIPWLWLGGAIESELPRSAPTSFLLPPAAQVLIESREATAEDRALFFSLLRNVEQGVARSEGFLCVSWPKTVGGKDVPPSALVQALLSLRLEGSPAASLENHWQQLQKTEEQALPPLLCEQELLIHPRADELSALLTDANLHERLDLHRRLRTERTDLRGFGRWDGVVGLGSDHRSSSLRWLRTRLKGKTDPESLRFSTTSLEAWARCPMRYFLQKVLGAQEPRPWSPDPGPPEQGVLVHRVLERFFIERIEQVKKGQLERSGLCGASASEIAAIKLRLRELVVESADEVLGPRLTPYRAELLRQLTAGLDPADPDNNSFAGRLSLFVDEEVEDFLDLDPVATEHSFEPLDPALIASRLDGAETQRSGDLEVLVSGTIDRLDEAREERSGLAGTTHAVYDYKTGKVGPLKSIDLGLNMQPVVYAAAAAPDALGSTVTGYRRLPHQPESGRQRLAGSPAALDALKAHVPGFGRQIFKIDADLWPLLLRRIEWYGQLIGTGFFPTTLAGSKAAGCDTCDYRRVCRHDALRVARVDSDQGGCGSFLPRPKQASLTLQALRDHQSQDEEEQA